MNKAVFVNMAGKYLSRVIGMAIGFFITPYLLGKLGPEVMALQIIAFQILQYSSIVNSSFSIGYFRFATVHYARGEFPQLNHILSQGLFLTLLSGLVTLILVGVVIPFSGQIFGIKPELLRTAYFVISATTVGFLFSIIFEVWTTPLYIKQKLFVVNLGDAAGKLIATIVTVVAFIFVQPSLEFWVAATVIAGILIQLALVYPVSRKAIPEIHIKPKAPTAEGMRSLVGFSAYTLIGSLGYLLYFSTDSIIISNMIGQEALTLYNIGQRWDPQIRALVVAFISGLTPEFTRLFSQGKEDELRANFFKGVRFTYLIVLLPALFLIAYSDQFLSLWVGPQYVASSSPVLKLIMACLALSISGNVSWDTLIAINKVRQASITTVLLGVLNVGLSILFVRIGMGIFGVGLGSVISLVIKDLLVLPFLVLYYLKISLGEYLRKSFPRPVILALALLAIAYGCNYLIHPANWGVFILGLAVYCLVGAPALIFIGLEPSERKALFTKLRLRAKPS